MLTAAAGIHPAGEPAGVNPGRVSRLSGISSHPASGGIMMRSQPMDRRHPPDQRFSARSAAGLAALLAIIAVATLVNWRLFLPGLPLCGDNPAHLAEIHAVAEDIAAGQRWWFGWFEGDFLGYPVLLYQYPLGKLVIVLLGLVVPLSVETLYKTALTASWCLPALGLFRLLRRVGDPMSALVAALLYLVSFDHLYLCLSGMWNQYLALGFLLLAAERHLTLVEQPDRRSLAAAAGWSALALCSHPFSYLMIPLSWACSVAGAWAAGLWKSHRRWSWLWCPLLAVGLSAWLLVPLLASWSWAKVELGSREWRLWPTLFPLALTDLMDAGTISGLLSGVAEHATGMLPAILLGVPAAFLLKSPQSARLAATRNFALLLIIGLVLLAAAILAGWLPVVSGIARLVAVGRFAPYLLVGLLLVLGCFLQSRRHARHGRVLAVVLAALILVRVGWTLVHPDPRLDRFYVLMDPHAPAHPDMRDLAAVWQWLVDHTSPSAGRILTQDTLFNIADSPLSLTHAMALTHHFTGAWTLGGFSGVLSPNARLTPSEAGLLFGRRLEAQSDQAVFKAVLRYGVGTIVSCEDRLETLLRLSPLFRERYCRGQFCVFEPAEPPVWGRLEGPGTVQTQAWEPDRRSLTADLPQGSILWIPTTSHPWWEARVDGRPVPIREFGTERFLSVELSAGVHQVEFRFVPPRWLASVVWFFSLGIFALLCILQSPAREFPPTTGRQTAGDMSPPVVPPSNPD